MTSYVTPKKNTAFILYLSLPSVGTTGSMQASPTLASGDVKVSIDGGALANIATLPAVTPAASVMVKVSLSSAEMNGDNITVVFVDQTSPKEWCDTVVNIQTSIQQVDDLASQASVNTVDDFLDTEIAAIKAKTDNLPTDPADASDIAAAFGTVNATLSTIAGYVDTEVAAIKTVVDAIEVDTQDIQGRLPAALVSGRMDSSTGAMAGSVITSAALATTAADEIAVRVWLNADRTLTALDEDSTTLDLDATIRAAVGLASADLDTQIAAIKTKTDSLTFTVAGSVDANIQQVNDVTVSGTGATGDEWGPV